MSEIEGTIHITRLSKEGEREPWAYDVAFAPTAGGGGALPVRQVHGDGELRSGFKMEGFAHPEMSTVVDQRERENPGHKCGTHRTRGPAARRVTLTQVPLASAPG